MSRLHEALSSGAGEAITEKAQYGKSSDHHRCSTFGTFKWRRGLLGRRETNWNRSNRCQCNTRLLPSKQEQVGFEPKWRRRGGFAIRLSGPQFIDDLSQRWLQAFSTVTLDADIGCVRGRCSAHLLPRQRQHRSLTLSVIDWGCGLARLIGCRPGGQES
jgi:hypothetical protein